MCTMYAVTHHSHEFRSCVSPFPPSRFWTIFSMPVPCSPFCFLAKIDEVLRALEVTLSRGIADELYEYRNHDDSDLSYRHVTPPQQPMADTTERDTPNYISRAHFSLFSRSLRFSFGDRTFYTLFLHSRCDGRDFPNKAVAMKIAISIAKLQWRIGKEVPRTREFIIPSLIVAVRNSDLLRVSTTISMIFQSVYLSLQTAWWYKHSSTVCLFVQDMYIESLYSIYEIRSYSSRSGSLLYGHYTLHLVYRRVARPIEQCKLAYRTVNKARGTCVCETGLGQKKLTIF